MKSDSEIVEYIQLLKMVVFAHRYNKEDEFLEKTLISFDIIRDPMYKFSRSAEIAFLQIPVLSFLLAWFAESKSGK